LGGLDIMNSFDPQQGPNPQIAPRNIFDTAYGYLRLMGVAIALTLLFTGLVLCFTTYGLLRELVESPEALTAYLESWEVRPAPATEVAEPEPEPTATAEIVTQSSTTAEENPATAPTPRGRQQPTTNRAAGNPKDIEDFFDFLERVSALLETGGIARIVGGGIIFLLTMVMAWISLVILKTGCGLLIGVIGQPKVVYTGSRK
jgi:hypothetical protein